MIWLTPKKLIGAVAINPQTAFDKAPRNDIIKELSVNTIFSKVSYQRDPKKAARPFSEKGFRWLVSQFSSEISNHGVICL